MKLTGFLLATSFMVSYGSTHAQITLKAKNAKVEQVLKNISKQTGYRFIYEEGLLKNVKADINFQNESLNTSLNEILKNNNFNYTIHGKNIVVSTGYSQKSTVPVEIQQVVFKGRVVDNLSGLPISGATVVEGNTSNIVQTDDKGDFTLNVSSPNAKILVRMVGYESLETKYSSTFQELKLQSANSDLDEVVVVGFGQQKKASVVGAISSVSGKELKIPTSTLSNAFAGRIAGVIAVQRGGEPGADGSNFWIRGISTFAGSTSPLIFIDGVESSISDMNNLAPEVIDNFSVLKDASATALYGARGANGVMLITTKRGGDFEKARINFRIDNTFSSPTKRFELANAVDYMEIYNYAVLNRRPTATPIFSEDKINGTRNNLDPILYPNVDWNDVLFKKFSTNQYANLNVAGGSKRADYFMSVTFNNDNGNLKNDPLGKFDNNIRQKEYNIIGNIGFNFTENTNAVVRLNSQLRDGGGTAISSSQLYTRMFETPVSRFLPYYTPSKSSDHIFFGNSVGGPIPSAGQSMFYNPYAEMVKGYSTNFATTNIASFDVTQKLGFITQGLRAKGLISYKNYSYTGMTRSMNPFFYSVQQNTNTNEEDKYVYSPLNVGNTSLSTSTSSLGDRLMSINFTIDWLRSFGKHDVSAMLTYLQRDYSVNNPAAVATSDLPLYWATLPNRNQGIAGRLTYGYDSKYFFEGNFGYNGSENFAEGGRFGFFPSIGVGYMVSNENFWEGIKPVVSNLKLRGSWGLVGNDQIAGTRFPYMDKLTQNSIGYLFGSNWQTNFTGGRISTYGAAGAKWEIGTKINAGFDATFYNSLTITADYFTETRSDIFMQRRVVPAETGIVGNNPYANIGKMKNSGFDGSLSFNKQISPDFYLNLRGTFTYAKNILLDRDEPVLEYEYLSQLGHPVNKSFGYISDGFYLDTDDIANSPIVTTAVGNNIMPGDIKYKDLNGDGKLDANDRTYFGNPTVPEISYGFGISSQYKKIDFSVFFQGTAKTSLMMSNIHPFTGNATNLLKFIADDYWREDNINAAYPRLVDGVSDHNNFRTSDFWQRDGSFIRLKNAELGYTYKFARMYLSGQNLLTFSKFKHWDPELGSGNGLQYPNLRVISVGAQLNF